jgi:hypothetical protein
MAVEEIYINALFGEVGDASPRAHPPGATTGFATLSCVGTDPGQKSTKNGPP